MRRVHLFLITLIGIGLLAGCNKKEEPAPPAQATETKSEPVANSETIKEAKADTETQTTTETEIKTETNASKKAASLAGLTYVKGDAVSFEEGKVYVVEFWATWCPPCKASIPHLTEIQKHFKDKGVTVVGISNETADTVKPFVEQMGDKMNYTVALDTKGTINDSYMKAYNQRGIPTAFIVDGKGHVAWFGHPMDGLDEVLALVVEGTFDAESYAKAKAERQAAECELQKLFQEYIGTLLKGADIEQTRPIAEKIIALNNPMALNTLAWYILTLQNIDDTKRDFETALKAAAKANAETNGENPMVLDTYALALSKNQQHSEAVAAQQKAIDLVAGDENLQNELAEMKERLAQYKAAVDLEI